MAASIASPEAPSLSMSEQEHRLVLRLAGRWRLDQKLPSAGEVERRIHETSALQSLAFDATALESWDSGLLAFLRRSQTLARQHDLVVELDTLPDGIRRLMGLASTTEVEPGARSRRPGPVSRLGLMAMGAGASAADFLTFFGEVCIALAVFVTGRARIEPGSLGKFLGVNGPAALPIITLVSVLVGLILAFIGAIQLAQFGAQIYVANLVTIGMAREMGAMMPAIVLAGRTGAAYAAEIGTMQVNEEVDALETFGLRPIQFVVLPRLIALAIMLPLLAIYANLAGMVGGGIIGVALFDISPIQYFNQSQQFIGLLDFMVGLVKAAVFAFVVGLAGCYHGIRCGRSSAAVGVATTRAVVSGIVGIVVADAILNVLFNGVGV